MNRTVEIILVVFYNLVLLAGASYLIAVHEFSAWIYLVALVFGAGWKDDSDSKVSIETGK